jgi:DNA polymerase-1
MRKLLAKDKIAQGFLPLIREPKYDWPEGFYQTVDGKASKFNDGFIGFDLETKGLNPYHPHSFVISYAASPAIGECYANVVQHNHEKWNNHHRAVLAYTVGESFKTLVGHNIKYDLSWLMVKYPDMPINASVFDTMLAQYFLDENEPAHLSDVLSNHLNETDSHKEMVNKADLESEALEDVLLYNAKDAEAEMRLLPVMVDKLKRQGCLKLALVGMSILPILAKMEWKGVRIDLEKARATRKKLLEQAVRQRIDLRNSYGAFDPDSPQDVARLTYGRMKFVAEKFTDTGNPSTDHEALTMLKDQATTDEQLMYLAEMSEYKKNMKLLSSVYQKVEEQVKYDGRFHARYNLGKQYGEGVGGTVTGRLSGNMQQIPRGKEHKSIFVPANGYVFIDGDFSQLELRVVAYLAREPVMIQAFEEDKDIHSAVMADLMHIDYDELNIALEDSNHLKHSEWKELRVAIKRINFGIVYGVAGDRLRRLLQVEMGIHKTKEWCDNLIKQWLAKYPKIAEFLQSVKDKAAQFKYVSMALGQKRRLPDADFIVYGMEQEARINAARALRQAQNFVVQGLASWICLIGMILVEQYLEDRPELDGQIVIQVHDSCTWEIRKFQFIDEEKKDTFYSNDLKQVKEDIQYIMEHRTKQYIHQVFGVDFNVPLKFQTKVINQWE